MRRPTRGRLRAAAAAAAGACALALAPAALGATTDYRGAFRCADGRPLAGARVELWQQRVRWLPKVPPNIVMRNATRADSNGAWAFRISGDETNWFLRVVLVGQDAEVRDFPWPWNWYAETLRSQNDRPVRDYGTQLVSGYQCGVWNGFSDAGREFREQVGRTPPQGVSTVLAGAITAGVPVTMYNAVWWPSGYPVYKSSGSSTARHEFAHLFRFHFDGGFAHFLFDSTYYWYLRNHSSTSCEKTNSGFAFNEGWAEFWAGEVGSLCPDAATGLVERNVAAMLKNLQDSCRLTRGQMAQVLIDHDSIHSIDEYTRALNCTPPKPKRLGKRPPKPIGLLLKERRLVLRAGRRFVASIGGSVGRVRGELSVATRRARRPPPCPRRPCAAELEVRLRPVLISARLGEALAMRRRFGFLADAAAVRRFAAASLGRQLRRLEGVRKAFVRDAGRIVARALGRARTLARRLGADRASLDILARAGRAAARGNAGVLAGMAPLPPAGGRKVGPTPGSAAPGDLDPSFSGDGKQTLDFGLNDRATHVVVTPDGRLVVVGSTDAIGGGAFAVGRVTADGGPDPAFGSGGRATFDVDPAVNDIGGGVVVLPDGSVVVAGYGGAGQDFVVKGLGPGGELGQTQTFDFGGTETVTAMVAQPDGKLVLVGSTSAVGGGDFAILRLNANLTPDLSFDTDGKQTVDFGGGADAANAVAIQPDGKIVVAGQAGNGDMAVTRLNTDGSVDTSFAPASSGKATVDFGGTDVANGVAMQADGKLVLAGTTSAVGAGDAAVARLDAAGALDGGFSGDGKLTLGNALSSDAGLALAIQQNGRIVVLAQGDSAAKGDFELFRLAPSGSADTSFGTGGTRAVDFGGAEFDGDVAIQPDGKIVVAGSTNANPAGYDIAFARVQGDPVTTGP